jgi:hypothetical protein
MVRVPSRKLGSYSRGFSHEFPGHADRGNQAQCASFVAIKFFDELIALEVLIPATKPLKANCPLFCVEKPHEEGAYRCIADAKSGGQNQCMGKDPVYLSRADDILPRLYTGGWSAVADASKHFHNFKTLPAERHLLGCTHPGNGTEWIYAGLPMGTTNSPAVACRLGNSGLRKM